MTAPNTYFPVCYCRTGGADPADGDSQAGFLVPAVKANPRNAIISIGIGDADMANANPYTLMVTFSGRLWPINYEIKVGFVDEPPTDDSDEKWHRAWKRDQVKSYAKTWSKYGDIHFTFPEQGPYEILCGFDPALGNFSVIGIDSVIPASKGIPTMNIGYVDKNTPAPQCIGMILHQFGHAIGMTHTYNEPIPSISWKQDAVYAELAQEPYKWSKDTVDKKLFVGWKDQLAHDLGDRKSIMEYAFPDSWVTSGKGSKSNWSISAGDEDLVAWYYPEHRENDQTHFSSMEVRHWNDPQLVTTKQLSTRSSSTDFVVGLDFYELDNSKNSRVKTLALNPKSGVVTGRIESWSDTLNYMSGLTWLNTADPDLAGVQTGNFSTSDVRAWTNTILKNSKKITFAKPFGSVAPKVIVWLTGIDFNKDRNIRIKTYATDITASSFTVNVESWSDSLMYLGNVTWLAYPGNSTKIDSGIFSTNDVQPSNQPRHDAKKTVTFSKKFSKRPKMFSAINYMDYDKSGTICGRTAMEYVTPEKFIWHQQSWWDSKMYGLGSAWIAWEGSDD